MNSRQFHHAPGRRGRWVTDQQ
jgi:predicted N-acetyltransferase YhbS